MRALIVAGTFLFVAAFAFGCADETVPTSSTQTVPGLSFNFTNGPEHPGESGVYRSTGGFIFLVTNNATLTTPATMVIRHYQSDDSEEVCGGGTPFPDWDFQEVTNPNDVVEAVRLLAQTGEIPVLIYPLFDGSKDFCDFLVEDWIYRGTHMLRDQDNNFFFDPAHTNAWGWEANGFVYDRDGDRYRYLEVQRFVVDPDPFRLLNVMVKVKIHPTGK